MAARYQIIVRDQAGVKVADIVEWRQLDYTIRLNDIGAYTLVLDGETAAATAFVVDGQVQIRRRDQDASPVIDWYTDFRALHRTSQEATDDQGLSLFTSKGVGLLHLLERRAILFRDTTTGALKNGPGERVIKAYVDENAGPGATAPPRLFNGVTPGLTIEADAAGGGQWVGAKPYRALLGTVREIGDATDVDFDVIVPNEALPLAFQFVARDEPLGTDRSVIGLDPASGLNGAGNPPVIFSLSLGNMQTPALTTNRIGEVTAAIILGQGAEVNREVVQRQGAGISDSPLNRIEGIKNANQVDTTAGLEDAGDAMLQQLQAREVFSFDVMQIPSTLYGRDYFVGDLVTARYKTTERNLQIVTATISVQDGREDIIIGVSDVT